MSNKCRLRVYGNFGRRDYGILRTQLLVDIAKITSFTKYNTGSVYVDPEEGYIDVEILRAQDQNHARYIQYVEALNSFFLNYSIFDTTIVVGE